MPSTFSTITFLGSIAVFIYGIRLARTGVQLLAGDRLRSLLVSAAQNRFVALATGIVTTLILQSSTATIVMLVGFASGGGLSIAQAMGILLGADIGTTFVVLLLSVRAFAHFSYILLIGGVILEVLSRKKPSRYVSMVLLGFGFVFFGMRLMIAATTPLQDDALVRDVFFLLKDHILFTFAASVLFTALVQNSATTIGLALALSFTGLIELDQALPIVIGANVGTAAGSLIASLSAKAAGRQVALAHLLVKATGAALALALLPYYYDAVLHVAAWIPRLSQSLPAQIALSHILFNLGLSILFIPFVTPGARLVAKLVPQPASERDQFGPRYLDPGSLDSPALAFANAKREILRMAEIAQKMFRNTITVFEKNDLTLLQAIEEEDDKVDVLDRAIRLYLARLSQEHLTPAQARMQLRLLSTTTDLEEICDIINRNLLELAEKKIRKCREFSSEGWAEICDFHSKVLENFDLTISILTTEDASLAHKAIRHERQLEEIEEQYRIAHLQRLHKGMKEAIETSSIHLDLLGNLRRVNSKLTTIVKAAVPGEGES